MERTFYIGNVKVIAVDNCTNPEERRKRLEKAIINFYKQAEREKTTKEELRNIDTFKSLVKSTGENCK